MTSEPGRVRVGGWGEGRRDPQQGTWRPVHAALTHTPDLATPTCSEGPNQMQWVRLRDAVQPDHSESRAETLQALAPQEPLLGPTGQVPV